MNNPVTFSFCLLEPIVSTVTKFLSIFKGCWLYLGDEGNRRERKLGSIYFLSFDRYIRSVGSLLEERE